ncbi:hypothetical protein, variant [Phialophora macrospora]|nr:hypothetical protein, variant [Phialophora macrospora]
MDAEPDRLAASQAAVLLVTWGSNKHSRDAFYWLGIAISLACALKMHSPEGSASLPKAEQSLRRRIWWTIIMKECDICLTLGRPPRVSPYRTALLQQEAFTNDARLTDYSKLPETGKLRRDPSVQPRLDMACMEKAKLSLVIYRILQLPRSSSDYTGNPHRRNARIWQLESELKDWRLQLPMELTSFNPTLTLSEDADRSLQMAISILHLTQLMALIMLHKSEVPFATWLESPVSMPGDDWLEDDGARDAQGHIKSMRQAAHEITAIHKTLHERGLTPSIPTIGVAAVCTAVFVCLLDARSAQASVRQASLDRLDTCLVVLRELGQINQAATDVTTIVESAIQTARDFPATPAAQCADMAQNPSLNSDPSQTPHELECTTHSYMEGVLPARSDKRPNIAGSDTPALFVSAFGSTGQDLFLGMEEFFDFV